MSEDRIRLAEDLLKEAVYQSRARQAAGAAIGTAGESGSSGCGLGESPEASLALSERGKEILHKLWPRETAPTEAARIRSVLDRWISRQDSFDRKRNHFLRDFRRENGFDRRQYSPAQARAFEKGLDRINAEMCDRLRESALKLLGD
ncbi:MAG TPA: hypothetical protein ENJ09_01075 [Planctomycetes bacterium]|nr:hypothetical protein [Planctomycetota bacterium]